MTGTYQVDGKEYSLGSAKNLAIYKCITKREVLADITSIARGCLDMDMMCDTDKVFDPDEFVGRKGQHQCPYCGEVITEKDEVKSPEELLAVAHIDIDDFDPEYPYLCPVCGARHDSENAARYCCSEAVLYTCPYCETTLTEDDLAPVSVPDNADQWLVVTRWLGTALANLGEAVFLSDEGTFVWARMKSDFDVANDVKIAAICASAQILEGQANYREVKA